MKIVVPVFPFPNKLRNQLIDYSHPISFLSLSVERLLPFLFQTIFSYPKRNTLAVPQKLLLLLVKRLLPLLSQQSGFHFPNSCFLRSVRKRFLGYRWPASRVGTLGGAFSINSIRQAWRKRKLLVPFRQKRQKLELLLYYDDSRNEWFLYDDILISEPEDLLLQHF
jgi:hypothetical protein